MFMQYDTCTSSNIWTSNSTANTISSGWNAYRNLEWDFDETQTQVILDKFISDLILISLDYNHEISYTSTSTVTAFNLKILIGGNTINVTVSDLGIAYNEKTYPLSYLEYPKFINWFISRLRADLIKYSNEESDS